VNRSSIRAIVLAVLALAVLSLLRVFSNSRMSLEEGKGSKPMGLLSKGLESKSSSWEVCLDLV
jgi:hypothetical protein